MKQSAIVAAIDGGDRLAGLSDTLTLDASGSRDPDLADATGDAAGLAFVWRCAVVAGSSPCNDTALDGDSARLGYARLPLRYFGVGTFEFTATAVKGERNASASVQIEVVLDSVPPVSVAALTVAKANPSARLVLSGMLGGGDAGAAVVGVWSITSGSLAVGGALEDVAATPVIAAAAAAGASAARYLVLPAGSLTPGGAYVFTLTASYVGYDDDGAVSGYSSLSVTVNAAPTSGSVAVAPRVGVVLQTSFELTCSSWLVSVSCVVCRRLFWLCAPCTSTLLVGCARWPAR